MKAWQLMRIVPSPNLVLAEVAFPTVKQPDSVQVRVRASSINALDYKFTQGYGHEGLQIAHDLRVLEGRNLFPLGLGRDFSGVVTAVGKNVKQFSIGDEVCGSVFINESASFADYVLAGESNCALKPNNINHLEAACISYAGQVAWNAVLPLVKTRRKSSRVFVQGGAGCVSSWIIQLLHTWGHHITTSCHSSSEKFVSSLGADSVLFYDSDSFSERMLSLERFDCVIETLHKNPLSKSLMKERSNSIFVTTDAPPLRNLSRGLFGGIALTAYDFTRNTLCAAFNGNSYTWAFYTHNGKILRKLTQLVEDKSVSPKIFKTFPFLQVPQALDCFAEGHCNGKVVIDHTI